MTGNNKLITEELEWQRKNKWITEGYRRRESEWEGRERKARKNKTEWEGKRGDWWESQWYQEAVREREKETGVSADSFPKFGGVNVLVQERSGGQAAHVCRWYALVCPTNTRWSAEETQEVGLLSLSFFFSFFLIQKKKEFKRSRWVKKNKFYSPLLKFIQTFIELQDKIRI